MTAKIPKIGCFYIPPDQCTDFTTAPCCERIENEGDDKDDGKNDNVTDDRNNGVVMVASMALLLVLSALAALL